MASHSVHDTQILDVLSSLATTRYEGRVYRAVFQGRDPTIGSLAGGRWSPPQTFEALYTSLAAQCAVAEVHYHLSRHSIFPAKPVELHTLEIATERTIDLTSSDVRAALGIDDRTLTSLDYVPCQAIGHAAEFLGFDSLRVPGARCQANNMVLVVGHLENPIRPISNQVVDWDEFRSI